MSHSQSQPIALPSTGSLDISGSYTGNNGSFNPASYTRHFLGSPISWRAGSFGSRFYPGASPSQLLGPLDPTDFRMDKMSTEVDNDPMLNALSMFERQDEMCRNFTCCGLQLHDLHALLEHFEEVHVVVVDPNAQGGGAYLNLPQEYQQPPSYFPDSSQVHQTYNSVGNFDPDDMELDVDTSSAPSSGAPTPPDTPISTPQSYYPTHSFNHSYPQPSSSCASPHMQPPVSAFDTTTVLPSRSRSSLGSIALSAFPMSRVNRPSVGLTPEAFNAYAGYSDYSSSMPGTVPSPSGDDTQQTSVPVSATNSQPGSPFAGGVPPALLFSSAAATPANTPSTSRVPSPSNGQPQHAASTSTASTAKSTATQQAARASTTLSRPASSLLLSKPFRCPKPNCNKSYKQANGLKYHITHGSCNFAPPKDLEQVQALLASKRASEGGSEDDNITEGELREVEREAERRLRPFACGVGECQRRYKNMNGLRYHYSHSGNHGEIGLALLASGQHECLQNAHGRNGVTSSASSRHSTPARSGTSTPAHPHYQQMAYQQQQPQQQQGQSSMQMAYQQPQPPSYTRSQLGNPMTTAPLAMPQAGLYMSG